MCTGVAINGVVAHCHVALRLGFKKMKRQSLRPLVYDYTSYIIDVRASLFLFGERLVHTVRARL